MGQKYKNARLIYQIIFKKYRQNIAFSVKKLQFFKKPNKNVKKSAKSKSKEKQLDLERLKIIKKQMKREQPNFVYYGKKDPIKEMK